MTKIPRFYYEAARELKDRDIEFLTLALDDEVPSTVSVVLTSEEEKDLIEFLEVVGISDIKAAVDECLRIESGLKTGYEHLVLGIDPGLKPGFAVLGDGKVVHAELLISPEEIYEVTKRVLDTYSGERITFRVGRGGGVYQERILKILQKNFDFQIEVVDETSTTPLFRRGIAAKDITAAINIALKRGRVLRREVEVYPKDGEIRNLQKESRKMNGDITINKNLAKRVARGELTIDEAIKIQRKK